MAFEINTDTYTFESCEGTLSHGTMRPADLIPAFLEAIRHTDEYCQMLTGPFGIVPSDASLDDTDEWWDSENAGYLLDELFDILNAYAPDGYYFGSHLGDGSDYGYWPLIEA